MSELPRLRSEQVPPRPPEENGSEFSGPANPSGTQKSRRNTRSVLKKNAVDCHSGPRNLGALPGKCQENSRFLVVRRGGLLVPQTHPGRKNRGMTRCGLGRGGQPAQPPGAGCATDPMRKPRPSYFDYCTFQWEMFPRASLVERYQGPARRRRMAPLP